MIKVGSLYSILIIAAIAILLLLSLYEILLKPTDQIVTGGLTPLSTYYGEDVLEFVGKSN